MRAINYRQWIKATIWLLLSVSDYFDGKSVAQEMHESMTLHV